MCVIMIGDKKKANEADIKKMWVKNSDGAGIAWNDGEKIHYTKGIMELKQLLAILKDTKIMNHQYIIHFRLSSIGGTCKELTHPFLIDRESGNPLSYSGLKRVLFHNGHDGKILDKMYDMMMMNKIFIPGGNWSDSRATATLAAYSGANVCNLVSGKFVIMGKSSIMKFGNFEEKNGFWYSNLYWDYSSSNSFARAYVATDEEVTWVNRQNGGKSHFEL